MGVSVAVARARRRERCGEMQTICTRFDEHPWAWAKQADGERTPSGRSATSITSPLVMLFSRSTVLRSPRMFPFPRYRPTAHSAAWVLRLRRTLLSRLK